MTVRQISEADHSGLLTPATVHAWRHGKRPTTTRLAALCAVLKVDMAELLDGEVLPKSHASSGFLPKCQPQIQRRALLITRLREVREERGATWTKVAGFLGIPRHRMFSLLGNRTNPNPRELRAIAEYIGTTVEAIMEHEVTPPTAIPGARFIKGTVWRNSQGRTVIVERNATATERVVFRVTDSDELRTVAGSVFVQRYAELRS